MTTQEKLDLALDALRTAIDLIEAENLDEKYDGEAEVIRDAIEKGA